jgi:uncharacterized protein YaaW (UPF0174 family)
MALQMNSKEFINTSIVHSSLKYINNNFELIVKLSNWIYNELRNINCNQLKLNNLLDKSKIEQVELLIKTNDVKDLLNNYILTTSSKIKYEVVELLIKYNVNIHIEEEKLLFIACRFGDCDIVTTLINNGADIETYGQLAMLEAWLHGHKLVVCLINQSLHHLNKCDY